MADQNGLTCLAVSPDGTRFATGSRDSKVTVWSVSPSTQPLHTWDASDDSIDAVAFTPDGTRMAAGGADFQLRLWSITTNERKSLDTKAPVKDLGFSRDGKRLLTGSLAGAARVWEVASGDLISSFPPVENGVATAAMNEEATRIAIATADDRIILYDLTSGGSLLEILRQKYSPTKLAFNSKGNRLAAANRNGKVRIYELDPQVLAERARETITLNPPAKADCTKYLSERDCAAYLSGVLPVQCSFYFRHPRACFSRAFRSPA